MVPHGNSSAAAYPRRTSTGKHFLPQLQWQKGADAFISRVRLLCEGALAHRNQGERSSSAPQKSVVCAASVLAKFHRAAEPTTPYTVSIKATTWQRRRCVAETQICGTYGRQTKRASGPVSQPSQRGSGATIWEREFRRTLKRNILHWPSKT